MITPMLLATKIGIYQYAISQILNDGQRNKEEVNVLSGMVNTLRQTQLYLYECAREQMIKEIENDSSI